MTESEITLPMPRPLEQRLDLPGGASNARVGFLPAVGRPLIVAWRYRELIVAVLRRELADRFGGSMLGWLWAILGPLMTLGIYLLAFLGAVHLPLASAQDGPASYALSIFVGLIVFTTVAEIACRAPVLLHEHAWFLKSSIFPGEILAWIAVLRSLTFAGISIIVLLVCQLILTGGLHFSFLLLPVVVVPLCLFLLGVVWILAALGTFTRDVSYLMTTFVPLMMVATPVFYSISDLPADMHLAAYMNPVGAVIEMLRALILGKTAFPMIAYGVFFVLSLIVCRTGYAVFERYKGIALDAI